MVLWVLALAAGLALAAAGTAWAQSPITDTRVEKFTETLSNEAFLGVCGSDEPFQVTATGQMVTHFTFFADGSLHLHDMVFANMVAIPEDGTGPTCTGRFRASDSENLRNVKQGDVIVETDTDINRFVARGSDGSRVTLMERHHFTYNANGEVTVVFEKVRLVGCEEISEGD